jgi:hypothetical protein
MVYILKGFNPVLLRDLPGFPPNCSGNPCDPVCRRSAPTGLVIMFDRIPRPLGPLRIPPPPGNAPPVGGVNGVLEDEEEEELLCVLDDALLFEARDELNDCKLEPPYSPDDKLLERSDDDGIDEDPNEDDFDKPELDDFIEDTGDEISDDGYDEGVSDSDDVDDLPNEELIDPIFDDEGIDDRGYCDVLISLDCSDEEDSCFGIALRLINGVFSDEIPDEAPGLAA